MLCEQKYSRQCSRHASISLVFINQTCNYAAHPTLVSVCTHESLSNLSCLLYNSKCMWSGNDLWVEKWFRHMEWIKDWLLIPRPQNVPLKLNKCFLDGKCWMNLDTCCGWNSNLQNLTITSSRQCCFSYLLMKSVQFWTMHSCYLLAKWSGRKVL